MLWVFVFEILREMCTQNHRWTIIVAFTVFPCSFQIKKWKSILQRRNPCFITKRQLTIEDVGLSVWKEAAIKMKLKQARVQRTKIAVIMPLLELKYNAMNFGHSETYLIQLSSVSELKQFRSSKAKTTGEFIPVRFQKSLKHHFIYNKMQYWLKE